MTQYNFTNFNQ